MECEICGRKIEEDEVYYGDIGTPHEGKPLCEECYFFDEPAAIVFYRDDEIPCIITETLNETNGDFSIKWRSIDPWRGYYEVKSEKYTLVNTAELLAYHESEEMLKRFDRRIRQLLDENDIDYARVFARSSNVFYQNYDLFVRKDQEAIARDLIAKAKAEVDYNNPKWYRNIIFEDKTLKKISKLFPERKIETDHDAAKLIEEMGEKALKEMQERLRKRTFSHE